MAGQVGGRREATAAWLVPLRPPHSAPLALYCLPHAGGSAALYRGWAELLPPGIALWGVEYPGRGTRIRETLVPHIPVLAEGLAAAIAATARGPYALFGHSMGSLVAYEACRALEGLRAPLPVLLAVAGHRAPHLPDPDPPVHDAPEAQFLDHLKNLRATPEEVLQSPELLELMLPILRADFQACETYRPPPPSPLPIPIAAYGGLADPDVDRKALAAWAWHTGKDCLLRLFPGDHFFVRSAADRVTAMLARDLQTAVAQLR